jgi:hypothetical protein
LLAIFSKKRSLQQTFLFILNKALCFFDVVSGLHKIKIKNRNSYPLDVIEHNP